VVAVVVWKILTSIDLFGFSQLLSLQKCLSATVGKTHKMLLRKERKKLMELSASMIHGRWRSVLKRKASRAG